MVAYALYIWQCPEFIRKYFSLKHYLEYEHSPRWLPWEAKKLVDEKSVIGDFIKRMSSKRYIKIIDEFHEKPWVDVQQDQSKLYFSHNDNNYVFAMPILDGQNNEDGAKTKIAVREIFWEIFGRFSSSKPFARSLIRISLVFSFGFFAVAFCQSIWTGLLYLIK
jgi:hypothetical protein